MAFEKVLCRVVRDVRDRSCWYVREWFIVIGGEFIGGLMGFRVGRY